MPREDTQLAAAKQSYHSAKSEGNRQEEARWANVIGDILKNRGEYVEALKWFRIDYDVSSKFLSEKHLLPTCQSLGEAYLRLEHFSDALLYQKKHLELAKNLNDLIEQQRASTQLGRTYYEMFMKTDDAYSIRNAKKYFRYAMDLAQDLKESPPDKRSSFLKEYIDAHNNIGMLELELDNFEEAEKVLMKGLKICDEEEVAEDNDGRTRLHHNLGNVYLSLRMWDKAKQHIERDIIICKNIGHLQGEAKGYINLGELHYKLQKYDDASLCYQKALKLAKLMEDEDALVVQIKGNIDTLKEAVKVIDDLKSEEQHFKKLARDLAAARGTPAERKCLLQLIKSLDCLIEKAAVISAWTKHLEFAKQKKNISSELYDKEKQGDSYLAIGESYKMLRNFIKALKWYKKALQMHKSIGNMEGQVMAKIGIGDVLDNEGNSGAAFDAFEEGYRIAHEAGLSSLELSSLENMHYIHMIRFDNAEEAKRLQNIIDDLKKCLKKKEVESVREDCCSETDTEGNDDLHIHNSAACSSPETSTSKSCGTRHHINVDELTDDAPLISSVRSNKSSSKKFDILKHITASPENASKSYGRKRVRLVLSDDEDETHPTKGSSKGSPFECPAEGSVHRNKVLANIEESTCSYRSSMSNKLSSQSGKRARLVLSDDEDEIHPTKVSSKGSPFECPAEGSVYRNKVPANIEESTCSYRSSMSNKLSSQSGKRARLVLSDDEDEIHPTKVSSKGSPFECPAEGSVNRNKVPANIEESTCSYRSSMSNKLSSQSGKRARLVLSDDEDEIHPTKGSSKGSPFECPAEGSVHRIKVPANIEESACSYRSSMSNKLSSQSGKQEISHSNEVFAYDVLSGGSKSNFNSLHNTTTRHLECQASDENYEKHMTFQLENETIHIKIDSKQFAGKTNIEYVKAQLACSYYLQLPTETRAKGLLPIIQQLKIGGRVLECSEDAESKDDQSGKDILEVSVGGWIQKPLIKLYIDFCKDLAETPNLKLLTNLYNLEVSEDEVIVSDCELQDVSITPLLNAMNVQGTFSLLNLSHNLLGNGTMEKLQQIFKSSGQNYGDLSLDLHSNRFGPTTLFQICQCPVLYDRLVMLNISGNRLTDACGSYLSTILKKCKALYSLNIENCSITSRTINKIADSLDSTSMLTQLYIGHNDSVSGVTIVNLLSKLVTMTQFSELSLSGLKLLKPATETLCKLAKTLSLSGLMLGGTNVGTEGALQLSESLLGETRELVKLDLSSCGLSSHYFSNPNIKKSLFCQIVELNIGGNTINQEGADSLAAVLSNPDCCIRVLTMNRCDLGLSGVLQIIRALSENNSLKELNLADNINPVRMTPGSNNPKPDLPCVLNQEPDNLEVADSEDETMELDRSCASSCEKITPVPECPLATAIGLATRLEILDLSGNGLSVEAVEAVYLAWTGSRAGLARRHVEGNTVHFSVRENRCCRAKPCCRRD